MSCWYCGWNEAEQGNNGESDYHRMLYLCWRRAIHEASVQRQLRFLLPSLIRTGSWRCSQVCGRAWVCRPRETREAGDISPLCVLLGLELLPKLVEILAQSRMKIAWGRERVCMSIELSSER